MIYILTDTTIPLHFIKYSRLGRNQKTNNGSQHEFLVLVLDDKFWFLVLNKKESKTIVEDEIGFCVTQNDISDIKKKVFSQTCIVNNN